MALLKNWMEKSVLMQYFIFYFFFSKKYNFLLHLWFVQAFQKWVDISEGFYKEMFHFEVSKKRFEKFRKF